MAKTLNNVNGLPQINVAFSGWLTNITLVRITQTIVDGFVVDAEENIYFKGVIQPLSPRKIALKPEGQRSWEWLQIHAFATNLNLQPNDRILYNAQKYKIMATNDYTLNNYIEYQLVKDYQDT